jgi:Na+/H+ antiporter NhaD/arsenite permease-like protein
VVYLISVAALVAVFAIATVRPINMGVLAFLAAFAVGGLVSDISMEEVQSFFPGDMFFVAFGITLLFGLARANGTLDVVMQRSLKLVRGKRWAIVWMMFLLAAVLMALGSVLAVAMLAPIAMPIAKRYGINPLLMGMMLSHGALGAAFSPITVYSVGIQQLLDEASFSVSPVALFFVPFLLNLLFAAIAFVAFGRDLFRDQVVVEEDLVAVGAGSITGGVGGGGVGGGSVGGGSTVAGGGSGDGPARPSGVGPGSVDPQALHLAPSMAVTFEQWITFAAIAALLAAALFGIDVGVAATCIGAVLLLVFPSRVEATMKSIAWSAVVLVCGVVTYMGVLSANGTIDYLGEKATELPWPLLTAFVLLLAVGLISAVGSSFGIILIALPLAMPLLEAGHFSIAAFIIALAFCATVVDVSPFSTNGVIVLATAQVEDRQRFQKNMLTYCGYVVLTAPVLAWLILVLPSSL